MNELDVQLLMKRIAAHQADGKAMMTITCSGLMELCMRIERAEFASRKTVELTPITDSMIHEYRQAGYDANGSAIDEI